MTRFFAKAGAAALIALAALSATVSTASAGGHHAPRGPGHGWHDAGPGFGFHGGRHDYRRGPRGCAPMMAVEKARWNGLRRAYVEHVSPGRVVVSGYRHHRYDRMVFANAPGCPLIRR